MTSSSTAAALLATLNAGPGGLPVGPTQPSYATHAAHHQAQAQGGSPSQQQQGSVTTPSTTPAPTDTWSSPTASHSHLPLSISQSINNPGLPSGVLVSSHTANGLMNASAAQNPSAIAALARAETPGQIGRLTSGGQQLGIGGQIQQSLHQPSASGGSAAAMLLGGGAAAAAAPGQGGKLLLPGGAHTQTPLSAFGNMQHPAAGGQGGKPQTENEKVYYLIVDLMDPATREGALLELSKKREQWDDLALVLWHSFGVMSALLQEIVSVYPLLSPPSLTAHASNRVCNALALLQCVASHNDTRALFLSAHMPLFLYPFLNTTSKTRPFEYLRLTSLGVIGALVKQNDNSDVINFLLSTEIIPLCLRIMETGSELSKTVAIFIVQKILLDDTGLRYIVETYDRFYAVASVLNAMVAQLVETQALRVLRHVIRCFLRLSDNPRAREALRACLPEPLRDATFSPLLRGDMVTKRCLATLLLNLSDRAE